MNTHLNLVEKNALVVKQIHEIAEWFGFETRNKYSIQDESGLIVGYAAEQQKGIFGFIFRQFLGHWRSFDVDFFSHDRKLILKGHHPFRWFFERIEIDDAEGMRIGAIQKRWSFFSKKFDVENELGQVVMEVSSPIWKIWTFPFMRHGQKVAEIQKRWSGVLSEVFTDRDNFRIEFSSSSLTESERLLVMASAVFIDLLYFERKAD